MTLKEQAFEYLNGKTVVRDGRTGTLVHSHWTARYPYVHDVHKLSWEPSEEAKRTESYQCIKRQLKDDWSTDLTDSDVWCDWLGDDFNYVSL